MAAPFQTSPEAAATTLVHLATSPEMSWQTGGYYRKSRHIEPDGPARDPMAAARLWQISRADRDPDASSQ